MMKKTLAIFLILSLLAGLAVTIASAEWGYSIMYVKTDNGKTLNVRSEPHTGDNIIGRLKYGQEVKVDWSYAGNDGWLKIVYGSHAQAFVMARYLSETKPGPAPTLTPEEKEKENEKKKLEAETASERAVDEPFYIVVRATRISGWINFRTGPSKTTARITSYDDGKELLVIGETNNWYKARDPETDKVGYIAKSFTAKSAKQYIAAVKTENGAQKLGSLNVHGEFELTCKLPEGYKLQVVNVRGDKIVASVLSGDLTKPQMYLSIAYDDAYENVERMNDMSDADLAVLEDTFRDMNDVSISYTQTGYGTKLLVARETGSDTDFVDILAIYKGYFVEFNMTPNPKAADQTLTDEQVQMCVDFLTDVDFIPVEK